MMYKAVTKTSKTVNLRAAPSIKSAVIGYILSGNRYDVSRVEDNWGYIKNGENLEDGWACLDYLVCDDKISSQMECDISITFTREELLEIKNYIDSLLTK